MMRASGCAGQYSSFLNFMKNHGQHVIKTFRFGRGGISPMEENNVYTNSSAIVLPDAVQYR